MTVTDETTTRLRGSTCVLLREGWMTHKCQLPDTHPREPLVGTVIRCTCGRRYIARRAFSWAPVRWDRRLLPWPRRMAACETVQAEVGR